MIKKILIANRGEIAVRITRTCRDMGISCLAVYDESDVDSLHVLLADESAKLASPRGYTDRNQIIQLALKHGADAIHPGYSFLSEDADFAESCQANGIKFIGPASETLKVCASKIDMLKAAMDAGLDVPEHIPEPLGPLDMPRILAHADRLMYPVAVKPYRGSSGKASRVAKGPEQLRIAVAATARDAEGRLNDNRIYLEKAIQPGRTIQIPFLADQYDNVVTFSAIDATIHRHVIRTVCETPAPNLSSELEERLAAATVRLVKALKYNTQGAVEFWLDESGKLYFTKLLASIPIEHSLTELITGLDFVAEQIKLSCGERAPDWSEKRRACAIQTRVYAEDLLRQSLPSAGLLARFRLPGGPHVRVDAYGYAGCRIPIHFDPLLATIAVRGNDRDECIHRMRRALRDTAVTGVKTNLARLQAIMYDPVFVEGKYNSYSGEHFARKLSFSPEDNKELAALAAVAYFVKNLHPAFCKPERLSGGWYQAVRDIE